MSGTARRRLAACVLALLVCSAGAAPSDEGDQQALLADADYAAGLTALRADDAAAALPRLQSALKRFPDAADLHNELGFTHRKLRQLDRAFEHYRRALAIDPKHRGAHEYIGEAYLMLGDLDGADRHLAALRAICVLPCPELLDLQQAIAAHRNRPVAPR